MSERLLARPRRHSRAFGGSNDGCGGDISDTPGSGGAGGSAMTGGAGEGGGAGRAGMGGGGGMGARAMVRPTTGPTKVGPAGGTAWLRRAPRISADLAHSLAR